MKSVLAKVGHAVIPVRKVKAPFAMAATPRRRGDAGRAPRADAEARILPSTSCIVRCSRGEPWTRGGGMRAWADRSTNAPREPQ